MPDSFITGVLAGYGIAIPVGAIAVLILRTGARLGFASAAAAGAGAASADGVYAALAAAGGAAIAGPAAPVLLPLRLAAAGVLAYLGARWLLAVRSPRAPDPPAAPARSIARTYAVVLGLTLLNPMTIVYFAALVIGLPEIGRDGAARAAFVAGAFLASFSWQILLAAVGASARRAIRPGGGRVADLVAGIILLAFAARILFDVLA